MTEVEKKRQEVTPEEVERTREVLSKARVPAPRNPRAADLGQSATYACMRCGHQWADVLQIVERICPQCRSNSVRWLKGSP